MVRYSFLLNTGAKISIINKKLVNKRVGVCLSPPMSRNVSSLDMPIKKSQGSNYPADLTLSCGQRVYCIFFFFFFFFAKEDFRLKVQIERKDFPWTENSPIQSISGCEHFCDDTLHSNKAKPVVVKSNTVLPKKEKLTKSRSGGDYLKSFPARVFFIFLVLINKYWRSQMSKLSASLLSILHLPNLLASKIF